jgi:hypothetical protein
MKDILYQGSTNIRRHLIKFSRHGDQATGICARQLVSHLILFETVYVFFYIIYTNLKFETFSSQHLSVGNFVDNIKLTTSNGGN